MAVYPRMMRNPMDLEMAIGADKIEDAYPLSPLQEGMLFNTLLAPRSGVDIEQLLLELNESVDVAALQQAWAHVVARHAVLRTGFRWEGLPEPRQEVHKKVELPWREYDWSGITNVEQDRETERLLNEDRRLGFDPACAPLFRLTLMRTGNPGFRLIWTIHHAILDGRSFGLILEEVFGGYDALIEGREYTAPTPRPYRDYIDWLRRHEPDRDERFWRTALSGVTAPTPLVIDHPPVTISTDAFPKGSRQALLNTKVTSALRRLAESNGFSLNTIVQGAWALLLHRYSGTGEVVLGVIRANRRSSMQGAESMIGLFVNTLPLRIAVDSSAALIPWLREIHRCWNEMRGHEHASLAMIQTWSDVAPGNPLFHTTVMFDREDLDALMRKQGGQWARRGIRTFSQTNYPLDLAAFDGNELCLRIDFERSRIDDTAAERMIGHLHALLCGMAGNPDSTLGELPLLTEKERHQIVFEWNDTDRKYPPDTLLHHLFEQQYERTPRAEEVMFDRQQLTNAELEARSNQLARFLQAQNVGPDVLVAICLERSLEMVIGVLGILKAGGAYVPLDPNLPPGRIAHKLQDTGAPIVLSQSRFQERLKPLGARTVCLDSEWDVISRYSVERPANGATPDNLAYVIYTSGSTGRPKGVMVSHAAICNHMHWMRRAHGLSERDVELQKSPLGFDASLWEFFAPLMSDARLVMARPDGHLDPTYLAETIRIHRVSTLQVVPSQLRMLLEEPAFRECSRTLERVYCGGEALTRDLCENFSARFPNARLYNMYGPTEGAIDSTYWICPRGDIPATIPIGRPIDNVRTYIVDPQMQLVPVGVPGELLVGGAGLARGYLNDPELSAKRFFPDPFRPAPGARVYRTGDRARYLPDGNIEFLGRIDHQVKIRGFRIELGEIEAGLAEHPSVREAVVIAREFAAEDIRLVAYVVANDVPANLVEQLLALIRAKVPEHMIPAYIVPLHALPLTAAGKLDREQLPVPHHSALQESTYVAPRTPIEEALASTWREVFLLEQIGVRDNFFDLGGHSLLLAKLISRVNLVYRVKLGVPDLIKNPTIEQVAREIDRQRPENTPLSTVIPLQEGLGEVPVYFIYAGPSEFRIARHIGKSHPVFGIEARWPMEWRSALSENRTADFPSMRQLVASYVAALREHVGSTPCALAGLSYAGLIAFEAARQIEELGGKVEVVFLIDAQARPPSPYQLAWQTWRRDWKRSSARGFSALVDFHSLAERLKGSWNSTLWVFGKAKSRLTSLFERSEPDLETLTGVLDEQGMPITWGLMDRLYSEIDKNYLPRPLDSRGVLLRTSEIEGRHIIADDDALGWENVFAEGIEIVPLAGGHYSIFGEHIPTIARTIDRTLKHRASSQRPSTAGNADRS